MNNIVPVVEERQQKAEDVIAIETLIKRKVEALDKLKAEKKQKKEMYEDSFASNPAYVEAKKKAVEVVNQKKRVVASIAVQPDVKALKQEVDDIALSIREQERGISGLLLDYTSKTETTQLELFDGRFASIVKTAKLSRPKKPKKRRFR